MRKKWLLIRSPKELEPKINVLSWLLFTDFIEINTKLSLKSFFVNVLQNGFKLHREAASHEEPKNKSLFKRSWSPTK
jgi:hypothetical protein